jgi:5-methylcytosine-specific restriction endonuclease McrA
MPPHERKHKIALRLGWSCAYCGVQTVCHVCHPQSADKADTATIDHVKPRASDGPNTVNNIVLACRECNTLKASHELPEGSTRLEIQWVVLTERDRYEELRVTRTVNRLILHLGWGSI